MKGEDYHWSRIYVTQFRDALLVSGREFDIDDEDCFRVRGVAAGAGTQSACGLQSREHGGGRTVRSTTREGPLWRPSYAERLVYDDRRKDSR